MAYFEVSNRVIGPMPFSPACVAFHQASVPMPLGATTPMPVTTTRRSADGRLVYGRGAPRLHHALTCLSSGGRERTIADWKPPKPLPVERATSTPAMRASLGV